MIILYHSQSKITRIAAEKGDFSAQLQRPVASVLLDLADRFQDEILVWCHESQRDNLNVDCIPNLFHHKKLFFSYNASPQNYFNREIGYTEDSPFINVNKAIRYPTWRSSSDVGAVHAAVINACRADLPVGRNFDYFLNSFTKRVIYFGLFCYSEPQLLKDKSLQTAAAPSKLYTLFRFTKQHYRMRWIFLLFFNLLIYEKRFPLFPLLCSFFYRKRSFNPEKLNEIAIDSNKPVIEKGTVDVLIPTIGRKQYVYDVLRLLAAQTQLPQNVILIEQNPVSGSQSELDFIQDQSWPFTIKHHFTHQTGACNARNIGLSLIESEFCFFADDDIVFGTDLIEKAMHSIRSTGNEIILISCHLQNQNIIPRAPKQFPIFGGGHSFVKTVCLEGLRFNMAYEFGFGEDGDFGMQLLAKGYDILFISTTEIIHLKAPMGGFRTKPVLRWSDDEIQPKPSPTVMFYRQLHDTKEQLMFYKTTVFFKNLDQSFYWNPIKYIRAFQRKWNRSQYWANELTKL